LDRISAAGPDGVPAILLKECKSTIARPLYLLQRKFLDEETTPHILKTSTITPIFKKGDQGQPANYRPISLTSHVIKIFEKIVRKKLIDHLEENNLLNQNQHGFRSGRSCLSQLLSHIDTILSYLEKGQNVDAIYLDFSKAFDKVDHFILLKKLESNGIKGKLLHWIKSFLTNRTQRVTVNSHLSDATKVKSGVPQGSVLGPLLFIIMIADIDDEVKFSILSCFADDTRLLKSVQNVMDTFKLQHDLNKVYKWTKDNNMSLNGEKFEQLTYGKDDKLRAGSIYLTDNGAIIHKPNFVKDLGVVITDDTRFSTHIDQMVTKSTNLSSWIFRTFKSREKLVMLTLWKSLVIPHLDYCSQLWSPTRKCEIQKIEMVQRTFIKRIHGMQNLSYWEQLQNLKLYSLERRRERYQIMYVWLILEGLVPNFHHNKNGQTVGGISHYVHQRHGRKCFIRVTNPGPYKTALYSSFAFRGPTLFNSLPRELRNITNCTKDKFKSKLDKYLEIVPDQPLIPGYVQYRQAESNSIPDMNKLNCIGPHGLDV
jgi:hypothetical protein